MTSVMGIKSQQQLQQQQYQSEDENDTENVINFNTAEKCYYREILDRNVTIICSTGSHDHGSSKVKLKNIVDYKWESKHYPGRLIAVHIDGKHVAYVINVNNKSSRMEGMIRVVNPATGKRALIKGMVGDVLDIQFAHIEKERLLASIDINSLYIHRIDVIDEDLHIKLIVKIEDSIPHYVPQIDRLVWCPYIDGTEELEEDSQLLVWSRGSQFQCFNIKSIVEEIGLGKHIKPNDLKSGHLKLRDDSITFSWASLSPDGTTLGVGCTNGIIRFYQVYKHDKEPRCLHQWNPHDGKPISSFFFLDNLTKNVCELYWSLAITCAENNTELKVWDCGKWECLQTVTLTTPNPEINPIFRVQLDRTSSYMILTNLEARSCYVLQIINNRKRMTENNSKKSKKNTNFSINSSSNSSTNINNKHLYESLVYIKSVAEFPLNWGILSYSIVDATVRRYKCSNENYLLEDLDEYDEENCSVCCVVVRMYIVQSKSMQECHILYQPTLPSSAEVNSTLSYDSEDSKNLTESKNVIELSKSPHVAAAIDKCDNKNDTECINEDVKPVLNPLEALFGIPVHPRESDRKNTSTTSIMSVAAAAAAAPTAISVETPDSRQTTPKSFTLMTPDAFISTATANETEKKSDVSTDVLNTLMMLAGVTGGNNASTAKSEQRNILNLVNNKIIEDHEHKKLQMKQTLEAQNKFIGRAISDNVTSGNSSPSREVQEILSLHEYDKGSSSGEEIVEENTVTKNKMEVPNKYHDNERVNRSHTTTTTATSNWPKAPDMHMVQQQQQQQHSAKHSAELQNAANLITQAVNASSNSNLNNCHLPPTLGVASHAPHITNSNSNLANGNNNNSAEIAEINAKMSQLLDLVKMQSLQIKSLTNEVNELRAAPTISNKNLAEFILTLEKQMKLMLEQYFKHFEMDFLNKMGTYMAGRDAQNRELRDTLLQAIKCYPLTQISDVISKVISMEVQRQIIPLFSSKIDQIHHQIHSDVGQRLASFELMIKDSITQACKNKNIIDAFGKSVLSGLQSSLQTAFIESMSSTLIPAYEKSSQHMFQQLHDAFSDGIKEFLDYFQKVQPMSDRTAEIVTMVHALRVQFDTMITKQKSAFTDGILETRKDVKSLEVQLARQLQDTIRMEVGKIIDNQVAAMRSQANTPAPVYGQRESIKMLIQQGQYNKAFHQALLANDLNLVEFTLKNADYNEVFYPKCCLEQKVLLSLMQQITADMSNHNELKQNYLSEALLAINRSDPITHEHAPKVLQELLRNCQMFLINYPKSSQCINVRMLMKAVLGEQEKF